MQDKIDKNIPESIIAVLRERESVYTFKRNVSYSEALAEDLKADGWTVSEYQLDFYGYSSSSSLKRDAEKMVESLIFNYKKKKSQNELNGEYFQAILDEMELAASTYEKKNVKGKEFHYQSQSKIYLSDSPGNYSDYTIETIDDIYFEQIIEVSDTKYNLIKKLKTALEELILSDEPASSNSESLKKLTLKLSVPEIALLFRLLDDEKLVEYKHKTEIYRHKINR